MANVCLDPGHGGRDAGAVRQGVQEKDLTLAIARAAGDALRRDHRVVLTRPADLTLPLPDRRSIADRARADLFVSIHVNASTSPRTGGVEVFVGRSPHARSMLLAGAILRAIVARFPQRPNRGIRRRGLGVLRQPRPAVLVECLFLSNPTERALLVRPSVQAALGRAIASGCEAALALPSLTAQSGAHATEDKGRKARRAARSPHRPAVRPA